MKIIRTLQGIYGRSYGILVFAACLFFTLTGLVWFLRMAIAFHVFKPTALVIALFFGTLLVYHRKLAALISGVITLFFSLFLFMEVATNRAALQDLFVTGMVFSLACLVSSGILVFSFLRAFKHSEDL